MFAIYKSPKYTMSIAFGGKQMANLVWQMSRSFDFKMQRLDSNENVA